MRWKYEPPDHNLRRLLAENLNKPTREKDPILRSVAGLLRGDMSAPDEVKYAHSILADKWQREVMEAFLLAGASPELVHNVLGIPQEVTAVYAHAYFDIDVFRNRLDVEAYARGYTEVHDEGFGKGIKVAAVELGLHYLCAMYGKEAFSLPYDKVVEDIIAQTYMFSKVPASTPTGSLAAKEARQWGAQLVSTIRTLPEIRDGMRGNTDDLRLRLMTVQQQDGNDLVDKADIIFSTDDTD